MAAGPGICLFGGSFNPPHRTHLRLARAALAQLPIDRVLVVPAGEQPLKPGALAPAAHRLAMCRLQFAGEPGIEVDDRELRRSGKSYTVDTLHELGVAHPGRPLFLLIGSDNLPSLPAWRQAARILELCTVVTFPREGHRVDEQALTGAGLPAELRARLLAHVLQLPADATSASALRRRLAAGERNLPELLPAVEQYAVQHRLYGAA